MKSMPAEQSVCVKLVHEKIDRQTSTHHGSLHPPSGHSWSKSEGSRKVAILSGCLSHLTGRPSWTWPSFFS